MDDELRDPVIGQVADVVREPVTLSSGFDERVMAMVERVERVEGVERLRRRRSFLGAQALLAASIAALVIGRAWIGRITAPSTPSTPSTRAEGAQVEFVVLAPGATTVNLVGDFNEWSTTATPLRAAERDGVWSVKVPLPPGRHEYAFVVDGERWMPDPSAPRATSDDFGTPNSVVTVTGQT